LPGDDNLIKAIYIKDIIECVRYEYDIKYEGKVSYSTCA